MGEQNDRRPFPQNPDELGLSQEDFDANEIDFQNRVLEGLGKEREKPHFEYIFFESPSEKQKAANLIREFRQYDDALRYVKDWRDDGIHPQTGIALEFDKTTEDCREKLKDFFSRHNVLVVFGKPEQELGPVKEVSPAKSSTQGKIIPFKARPKQTTPPYKDMPKAA